MASRLHAAIVPLALCQALAAPAAAQPGEASAETPVPIESVDLERLLARDVRGGEVGSYGRRLSEYRAPVELHGYVTAELIAPLTGERKVTFDLHHLVLMARANLFDRVIPEVALEWEHAGEEFYVPFGFVDFRAAKWLVVRAGYFPAPIGAFNEYQYPDFLRQTVRAPLVMQEVVPALWSEVGLQLRGKVEWRPGRGLNYAVFVSNGLEQRPDPAAPGPVEGGPIRAMRRNAREEFDAGKAVGGRLGVTPLAGLDAGVSAYTGAYTPAGDRRLTILDADLTLQRARLLVRAEGAAALQQVTGDTRVHWGAYLLGSYRVVPFLAPFLQVETLTTDAPVLRRHRLAGGLVVYPFPVKVPGAMLKLEGSATRHGSTTDGEVVLQATVGF